MRIVRLALIVMLPVAGASCASDPDAARQPAPRVAPSSPEPPKAVGGEAPGPQPPARSGSKPAAAALCKALGEIPSDDPEAYIAGLRDDAAKAGFGFGRLIAAVRRALAAEELEKAGNLYTRLGTLCEDVVGRRNF